VSHDDLCERIGHGFRDPTLLDRALSHRSWCAEHGDAESNERLEFLGDAVLGWAIADISFHRYGDVAEGRLTDLRKSVVNAAALAEVAEELRLGDHVKLGRGEEAAGGAAKTSILSDALEAVIGAVYLDGGSDAAFRFVDRHVATRLDDSIADETHRDWKTELQELCARRALGAPVYSTTDSGPDHAKVFTATVEVDRTSCGSGDGRSKKAAEQVAARVAVRRLS
jgi:ribonuclease-3